ncbi:MAG: 50S ribosomal protein L15 [Chitinivibrionales bacterium]|nr:50S ribosomal protein L15 [Chitinivibrionales bacterium]
MLTLNSLTTSKKARKPSRRVGRGQGSGKGTTCGFGNNGAKARSGRRHKPYYEGGQTPLSRRIPKRGFTHIRKTTYQIVNIHALEKIESSDKEIDTEWLYNNGLVRSKKLPVKILGQGEITKSIVVKAHSFSNSAKEKIEKAKGKAEVITGA